MIPYRPAPIPTPTETIQARLARLRSEQRQSTRSTCVVNASSSSSTSQGISSVLLSSMHQQQDTSRENRRRRVAGPPAPKSWLQSGVNSGLNGDVAAKKNRSSSSSNLISPATARAQQDYRDKLLRSLDNDVPLLTSHVPSLSCTCAEIIAADLSLSSRRSTTLPYVHLLPNHLRLNLFDTGARSGNGLEERAIIELLRPANDLAGDGYIANVGEESADDLHYKVENIILGEDVNSEDDWEIFDDGMGKSMHQLSSSSAIPISPNLHYPFTFLTVLNLAFSPISLPFLRSLLLSHRSVPLFPHLSSLNLAATPRLPFIDSFFSMLASLVSLRHLSLAGKRIQFNDEMMTSSAFLARLASSTPTLFSLDLSYVEFPLELLANVDWDKRWLDLSKIGLRNDDDMVIRMLKESTLKDVRDSIVRKGSTRRKRKWIEFHL